MSLISFHRALISVGIVFCLGFGAWELLRVFRPQGDGSVLLGITFVLLGIGLSVYLSQLARILGRSDQGPGG